MDWVTAIATVGFPVALVVAALIGAGRFINDKAWPFLVKVVGDWQAFEKSRSERDEKRDDRLISVIENNTKALAENMQAMQALRQETTARLDRLERAHRVLSHRFARHTQQESNGK